jgi:ubiquinone/menaquinone biosynthesis C-methylase UbiE
MTQNETQSPVQQQQVQSERNQLIQSRFGAAAQDYVTSAVHAQGPDLPWLVEIADLSGKELVADVATGTGHTALALAPYAREVIAIDFTVPMLEAGQQLARERSIENIRFVEGDAHALPLADSSVDVVACRKSAHHFVNAAQAASEWARVLKPGGRLFLIDSIGPEDPVLDDFVHEIEVLRDPSHVRNHRISKWLAMLKEAGFDAHAVRTWGIRLDIPSWTQRMRTPAENVQRILDLFSTAAPQIRAALHIENIDGVFAFDLPTALIAGTKKA